MRERAAELISKIKLKLTSYIQSGSYESSDFDNMMEYVEEAARQAFGVGSNEYTRVSSALSVPFSVFDGVNPKDFIPAAQKALSVIASIEEIHSELIEFDPELAQGAERVARASTRKVFVVHGHDTALREMSARFLEKAGLEPIILAEQAGRSQTIIEKLEDNSDVAFAVILLTADDVGGKSKDDLGPRARQNVVFELGYFVGLLTRKRVCALVDESIEKFSDIDGVNYVAVDAGGAWKNKLAKELDAAGLSVDLAALL